MLLKNVLEIKKLVTKFNGIRNERNYEPLRFDASMFSVGEWAMDISIPAEGCLFSRECSELFPLLSQLDCSFFIGTSLGYAKIYIQ